MKNKNIILSVAFLSLSLLSGCSNNKITSLTFSQSEYVIKNNDAVVVKEKSDDIIYSFAGDIPSGLSLNEKSGVITFDETIPNYTQVLYYAYLKNGDIKSDYVVLTLTKEIEQSVLNFVNPIDYISNGDYILATNSNGLSIKYELIGEPNGISIDSVTGRISFTDSVINEEIFEVKISSHDTSLTKEFIAATKELASVKNNVQSSELNSNSPVAYFIDFDAIVSSQYTKEFVGVMYNKQIVDASNYTYSDENKQLTLLPSFLNTFTAGENEIIIITSRNTISVSLLVATKFIRTASDLASIGENRDALKGYYILLNDIDLTSYLSLGGEGYNDGKGWDPIGIYHDVTDGTALLDTFQGTFDGNGYTISGLYINRSDELSYNSGLFGYVSNLGVIKNLGVTSREGFTNSVRSYSGGLVGFNAGNISNCWADVDLTNYSGENIFRIIGGLVGRNEGTITNCFAYGSVSGDESVGSFAGYNSGTIENCFASIEGSEKFIGDGLESSTSIQFNSLTELYNYNYSDILDVTYWTHNQGEKPKLNQYLQYYFLFDIEIANADLTIDKGDVLSIEVTINPMNLYEKYIDQIIYTIDGEGYVLEGNKIYTSSASEYELIVTISLTVEETTFTDTKTFTLYDKVESVTISSEVSSTMEAGQTYQLICDIVPLSARQDVEWHTAPSNIEGIVIDGDMLTITDEVEVDSFNLYASASGINSNMVTITVKRFIYLENIYTYNQNTLPSNIKINIPSSNNVLDALVLVDGEEANYETEENNIVLSSSLFTSKPNESILVSVKTNDGGMYKTYVTYFDHPRYDEEYLKSNSSEYITLSTKEDFYKYFNMKDYDESRFDNYYSKTFILTADIDFGGETIYGIGYEGSSFSGKIYGNGHKISNANINENEQYFTFDEAGKQDNYRSSKYAVGFFGAFNGEIYDVVFENIDVYANNWVGTFACTIETNAVLENISFINCSSIADGGSQGDVAPTIYGELRAVYYDYRLVK